MLIDHPLTWAPLREIREAAVLTNIVGGQVVSNMVEMVKSDIPDGSPRFRVKIGGMKKFSAFLLLLTALLAAQAEAAQYKIVLAANGKSAYSICVASDASPSEKYAAQELQNFLEKMSGARLPVTMDTEKVRSPIIIVGNSRRLQALKIAVPFERLGPEGFALKTSGPNLVIAGGRLRGTLYGVYAFLEKLGCRWFSRELNRIPRMPTIRIERLDEIQKPAFEYREPYFTEAFDGDWAVRNKVNGNSMQLDESRGGKVKYYPFVHSFYQMLPPERYFKDHPEYYSLIDGKRRFERGQLCLTNPDVLRLGVEAVNRWIDEHPNSTIFSVSQNDWTGWCECDNCRRVETEEGGEHSGPVLRYVNALAAEIEKEHPDKLIDTLAYWYTEGAPAKARPRRNVRIRLCPIGVCEAHPYEMCPRSAYFMKNLRAWSKITNQLYIWHYNTNFSHYLIPFPDFDELAADIPMYHRNGVVGLFLEGAYPPDGGAENAELRSYVMSRLLWDVNTNVGQTIDEFMQTAYGKAAPYMRDYLELLHNQVRMPPQGSGTHIWIFNVPHFANDFTVQARKLFRQAEETAENDLIRRRIQKARLPIDYLEYLNAKAFSVRDGWYAPSDPDELLNRFRGLLADIRSFGMTSIREGVELPAMEKEFSENIRPYRVQSIENESVRVNFAPELGGRVVNILDKRTGRELLAGADSGDNNYPNLAGWSAALYPEYHARKPIAAKWEIGSEAAASELSATATCERGLILRRTIKLAPADGTVSATATVRNGGNTAVDVAMQSRIELDPGDPDSATVTFTSKDGKAVELNLIQPEKEPAGNQTYIEADQPNGEWRLLNRGDGRITVCKFPTAQTGRVFLNWSAKGTPRVVLGIWSPQTRLEPGQSLSLDSSCQAAGR